LISTNGRPAYQLICSARSSWKNKRSEHHWRPITRAARFTTGPEEHELRGVGRERLYLVLDGYRVDERPLRAPVVEGNLPRPPTSFVGGQRELTELCSDVAAGRLVTLSGPGGIGKTRLAIEAAWSIGSLLRVRMVVDAESIFELGASFDRDGVFAYAIESL
jgi:hypothetical protein